MDKKLAPLPFSHSFAKTTSKSPVSFLFNLSKYIFNSSCLNPVITYILLSFSLLDYFFIDLSIKLRSYNFIKGLDLYSSPSAILSPRPAARITAVLILLFKDELDCPINC